MPTSILLGVNIDHVATLRQARGTQYPNILEAAFIAESGGADGITVHLREDRRHIQDSDVIALQKQIKTRLNLEMAATEFMIDFALEVKPKHVCFVPEKRQELTTEGGLNVLAQEKVITQACTRLQSKGIQVSLFIDPNLDQVDAAIRCGTEVIEIHTGQYAESDAYSKKSELKKIYAAAARAHDAGLIVNAGHGLNYDNVKPIAEIPNLHELNIGHSIIARALFTGLFNAVKEMRVLINESKIIHTS